MTDQQIVQLAYGAAYVIANGSDNMDAAMQYGIDAAAVFFGTLLDEDTDDGTDTDDTGAVSTTDTSVQ